MKRVLGWDDEGEGASESAAPFCTVLNFQYACIECLTPCDSLYKQYSTPSSVRLTRCNNSLFCDRDVDPYMEREWLLVALDLILHRRGAYRHLYLHDRIIQQQKEIGDAKDREDTIIFSFAVPWRTDSCEPSLARWYPQGQSWILWQMFQIICLDFLLEGTMFWTEVLDKKILLSFESFSKCFCNNFAPFLVRDLGALLLVWSICAIFLSAVAGRENSKRILGYSRQYVVLLVAQLFLALYVPAIMMSIITRVALIWEQGTMGGMITEEVSFASQYFSPLLGFQSTQSVQAITLLLTMSQQLQGIYCIIQRHYVTQKLWRWAESNEYKPKNVDNTAMDIDFLVKRYLKTALGQESDCDLGSFSKSNTAILCNEKHCLGIGLVAVFALVTANCIRRLT